MPRPRRNAVSQSQSQGGWSGGQDATAIGGWGAGTNGGDGWGAGASDGADTWGVGEQTNDLDWNTPAAVSVGGFDNQTASAPPPEPTKKSDKKSKKAAAAAAAAATSAPSSAATFAGLPADFGAPPTGISHASQSPAVKAASGWATADGWGNGSPAAKTEDDLQAWGDAGGDGEWPDSGGGAQSAPTWSVHSSVAAAPAVVPPPPPPPAPAPAQAPAVSALPQMGTRGGWMNWGREASNLKVTTAPVAVAASRSASASLLPPPPPSAPSSVPPSALPLAAVAPPKDRPVMSPQQRADHLRSLLTHPSSGNAKSAPPQPQTQASMNTPAAMDKRQQAALYQQAAAAIGSQLPQRQGTQDPLVQAQQRQAMEQAQQMLQARMHAHQRQQQQHQRQQQPQQYTQSSSKKGRRSGGQSAPQIQQSDSWGSTGWTNVGYSDWADPIPEEDEEEYEEEDDEWGNQDEEDEDDRGWGNQDDGWGKQDTSGWGAQDSGGWGKQDSEWGKQDSGGEKQDTYGYGWGTGEQATGWEQATQTPSGYGHRVRFSPSVSYQADYPGARAPPPPAAPTAPATDHASFHPSAAARPQTTLYPSAGAPATPSAYQSSSPWRPTTLPSPSKTFAMASGSPEATQTMIFELQPPRHGLGENAFHTSRGHALMPAERALFSRSRPAKQRIRWSFNPDKDPRVSSLLKWVHAMSNGLATIGLQRFIETGERGALVANADYRVPGTAQPAFDWITISQLQSTLDRVLQESVALYDPAMQVIVFVFLLSQTGNSMAVWRRKLAVPESLRTAHEQEIQETKEDLDDDYPVYVEELPPPTAPPKKKRNFLSKLKWRKKEKT
ncbi:hypothetical protein DAEQUDRAFT_768385 [Daedalea quercina L-15889]|uniref:CcmS related domain-containing protein n=1 Tax=Daedalea quercina L-15889 TaxID=1314783 RepID=A0A165MRG1_9APHY|nr:hypothetical protein DAEQUDRAFT_768385 [Daedalea quercina L-15889]